MPAKSKSQQRLFGMIHAQQKGTLGSSSPKIKAMANKISPISVGHFASTKHKGLPKKKRRKSSVYTELGKVAALTPFRDPHIAEMLKAQHLKGPFGRETNYRDLGTDDLDDVELLMELEDHVGTDIPDDEWGSMVTPPPSHGVVGKALTHLGLKKQKPYFQPKFKTLGDMEDYLDTKRNQPATPQFQYMGPSSPPGQASPLPPMPQEPSAQKAACSACGDYSHKAPKKVRVTTKQEATQKMAIYVEYLAKKATKGKKSAANNPLLKLAPAIRKHANFFKALNEVYSGYTPDYRAKIAKGLVAGLEKKLEKAAIGFNLGSAADALKSMVESPEQQDRETAMEGMGSAYRGMQMGGAMGAGAGPLALASEMNGAAPESVTRTDIPPHPGMMQQGMDFAQNHLPLMAGLGVGAAGLGGLAYMHHRNKQQQQEKAASITPPSRFDRPGGNLLQEFPFQHSPGHWGGATQGFIGHEGRLLDPNDVWNQTPGDRSANPDLDYLDRGLTSKIRDAQNNSENGMSYSPGLDPLAMTDDWKVGPHDETMVLNELNNQQHVPLPKTGPHAGGVYSHYMKPIDASQAADPHSMPAHPGMLQQGMAEIQKHPYIAGGIGAGAVGLGGLAAYMHHRNKQQQQPKMANAMPQAPQQPQLPAAPAPAPQQPAAAVPPPPVAPPMPAPPEPPGPNQQRAMAVMGRLTGGIAQMQQQQQQQQPQPQPQQPAPPQEGMVA